MDTLGISIIVVSIILAVVFKWYLFLKIRQWMDRDLISQLASGDPERMAHLHQFHEQMIADGIKRADRHQRLHQAAETCEPLQD